MAELPVPPHPVGTSLPRVDAVAKVTGAATYAADANAPGMLHAKVVRSTRAHARLVAVEAGGAESVPGFVALVTGADLTGLFPRFGHILPDHPILALDKVRYYGEPVALVLAEGLDAAADAAELVDVRYEDLPAAMDPAAALADDAPLLHDTAYERAGSALAVPGGSLARDETTAPEPTRSNVAHESHREWGDVDAALAGAHLVVETTVHYPMLYAYAMEPYNALAELRGGVLDVTTTAQHPFMVQRDLARIFSLPLSHVRVRVPFLGGGYGSKSYTKVEPLAAVGAWRTGRPVKLMLDVEEAIYTTRADSADITVRTGFDADGRIIARDFVLVLDTGAYADNSPLVLDKAVNRCFGPYRIPNLRVRGTAVYTTTAPASSYRGFGAFQGNLAGETNIDQAADQLGLDPVELRRRNLVAKGETFIRGRRAMDADLAADLDVLAARVGALQRDAGGDGLLRGAGIGCSASDAGAIPTSTAQVRVQADGSVLVLSGSSEMGQGSRTVLTQIAAAELGVGPERVRVLQSDTAGTSFERTTGASRTTTITGLAVQRACADALDRLRAMAADVEGLAADTVTADAGELRVPDGRALGYSDVIARWFGSGGGEVTGLGVVRRTGALAELPPFWEIGMVGVALAIDPDTGVVRTEHLVTVADVGFAINPAGVEGQDLGAATQGLGGALYEELHYDGPQIVNANVVEYRVPRVSDIPARIDAVLAQRRDGPGPYGAKGAGEGALNPIGSAVASAVARAVGVWPDRLPLTPERVWRLLQSKQAGSRPSVDPAVPIRTAKETTS